MKPLVALATSNSDTVKTLQGVSSRLKGLDADFVFYKTLADCVSSIPKEDRLKLVFMENGALGDITLPKAVEMVRRDGIQRIPIYAITSNQSPAYVAGIIGNGADGVIYHISDSEFENGIRQAFQKTFVF